MYIGTDSFFPRAKDELPPYSPLPLQVYRPHEYSQGVWDSAESSSSGVWGQSLSRQKIWCTLESKSAALMAAVLVDFPKIKCNFLHKKQA